MLLNINKLYNLIHIMQLYIINFFKLLKYEKYFSYFNNLKRFSNFILNQKFFLLLVIKRWNKKKTIKRLALGLQTNKQSISVYRSFLIRDPIVCISIFVLSLNRVSFFSHRKMIKRLMLLLFINFYKVLTVCGFYFYVIGKISVGGNSRTRSMTLFNGIRSNNCLPIRVINSYDIIHTLTGCLGIKLYYYY